MREFVLRILTISLLCGLIEQLTPAGEREGLRRSVRLLAGLFVLICMLTPLSRLDGAAIFARIGAWAREMEQTAQTEYEALMEEKLTLGSTAQLEEELYGLLERRLDLSRSDCTVRVETAREGDALVLAHVWVSVRGRAVLTDPRAIQTLIEERLECPCTVAIVGREE